MNHKGRTSYRPPSRVMCEHSILNYLSIQMYAQILLPKQRAWRIMASEILLSLSNTLYGNRVNISVVLFVTTLTCVQTYYMTVHVAI